MQGRALGGHALSDRLTKGAEMMLLSVVASSHRETQELGESTP
jgi:hypothetical protein